MKRFITLTLSLMILSACDPVEWLDGHVSGFYIKNITDNTLEVVTNPKTANKKMIVDPKDSIMIYSAGRYLGDKTFPPFEDILKLDDIYIYDTDGNVLRKWHQAGMTVEENGIFKEDEWRHYKEPIEGPLYFFIWVYDIRNEDIEK